ncbi:hypothetical protein [Paludibacterium purpuratum]|uniref:Uncharacterized protein n=1 Tax=Paludibacterium purpuratum TaxID=1144873 RepID=A0A4R7B9A3_9NEIS|nr:hypothetical protein [Paludibacterium purpuratum]TDR80552.1 hypothetical protein DFP86_10450 [Paludibacterium purpuratum]
MSRFDLAARRTRRAGIDLPGGLYMAPAGPMLAALAIVLAFLIPSASPWQSPLLIAACLAFALPTAPFWLKKLSGQLALLMLAVTLALTLGAGRHLDLAAGLMRYRTVVELMFGIAMLQRLVGRLGLQALIMRQGDRLATRWRAVSFGALASLLALPLSMATIPLFATVLGPIARPRMAAAKIPMRAVSLTMLIVPTTVASAAVSASLPGLDALKVALLGAPLFVLGLASLLTTSLTLMPSETPTTPAPGLVWYVLGFWGCFLAGLALGLAIPSCIALAGAVLYLADTLFTRRSIESAMAEVGGALQTGSAEVVLLLTCGLLAQTLAHAPMLPGIGPWLAAAWQSPWIASALLVFALPLIAALGVHPLILFNLLFPLVNNAVLGSLTLQYLAWSTMFLAAQLLSPVSISALLAAASLSTSPNRVSFGLHLRFSLAMGILVFGYLNGLRYMGIG